MNDASEGQNTGHDPSRCVFCGSSHTERRNQEEVHPVDTGFGIDTVTVIVSAQYCHTCKLASTDHHAEAIRDRAIRDQRRKLIATEILATREASGFSRSDWLQLTKLGDASLTRWETGAGEPTAAYAQYMFLLRFRDNVERLLDKCQREAATQRALAAVDTPDEANEQAVEMLRLQCSFPNLTVGDKMLCKAKKFVLVASQDDTERRVA